MVEKLHIFGMQIEDVESFLYGLSKDLNIIMKAKEHIGGWGVLKIKADSQKELEEFIKNAYIFIPALVIRANNIIEYVVKSLIDENKTITFAESCTGGLLASKFTQVAGVSLAFNGSFVTYSNELKSKLLGIDYDIITNYGAVSGIVVKEMSKGAILKTNADFSLSISGIAGPNGGSIEKPVGTVFIATASKYGVKSERHLFSGDRKKIQKASVYNAIRLLIEENKKIFKKF